MRYLAIDSASIVSFVVFLTLDFFMPSIFYAGEAIRKIRMKDSENCQISSEH